ncbi:MAG: glycogen/starch synthase [Candidatus Bathyarchaeia archaeon]
MRQLKNVWILSFECAGVVKVGGLGEAVYNIAKHLANKGLDVTLFIPSHGAHRNFELMERLKLKSSSHVINGIIQSKDFLPYKAPFKYKIGVYEGWLENFKITLFYGLNTATSQILDDTMVYRVTKIEDKALLFARGIAGFIQQLQASREKFPDLVHAHDYHAVPAAVLAKQKFEEYDHKVAMVFTIHLLSGKRVSWKYLCKDWCGIENKKHPVYLNGLRIMLSHKQLLRKAKLKLETFGAMEAHVITSVSRNYLHDDVLPQVGMCCKEKAFFHWNGCDWNFILMLQKVLEKYGEDIRKTLTVNNIERYNLREYFLTRALGNLTQEEPFLEEGKIKETVYELKYRPFCEKGKVEPFKDDGPMVLMTGRLTKQKGVDVLFKAIPYVLKHIPNAKFVLLLLPIEEEINLVKKFAKLAHKYSNSVRIIFGKVPSIYSLAHLASDIFTCPSRWEPFGIMALEAMATGNPVIATATGGLKEIVLDVTQDLENGTGMLIQKNDHKKLAEAILSLLFVMWISEEMQRSGTLKSDGVSKTAKKIPHRMLRSFVLKQPAYGIRLRENAIRRVEENFRWEKVINMIIDAYRKAGEIVGQL